jgi:hypothetical protein
MKKKTKKKKRKKKEEEYFRKAYDRSSVSICLRVSKSFILEIVKIE